MRRLRRSRQRVGPAEPSRRVPLNQVASRFSVQEARLDHGKCRIRSAPFGKRVHTDSTVSGIRAVLAGQRNGGQLRRLALEKRGEPRRRLAAAREQELIGIGTITAGMLGLLAFTISLTINIAQNRYEIFDRLCTAGSQFRAGSLVAIEAIGPNEATCHGVDRPQDSVRGADLAHNAGPEPWERRPTRRRAWSCT